MGFLEYIAKAYREELRQEVWPFEKFLAATVAMFILFEASWFLIALVALPSYLGDPIISGLGAVLIAILVLYVFLYPYFQYKNKGDLIDQEIHLFITRMGVLSASEASRKEMFEVLAGMREYGNLAKEIDKIFTLVSKWNVGLEKACRTVSSQTPSEIFANFLLRLAHAVETGESAEEFFLKEQTVIMDQYQIRYNSAIRTVEIYKDVFIMMTILLLMLMVLASFLPFITLESSRPYIIVSGIGFLLLDAVMIWFFGKVIPGERIWHNMKMKTIVHKKIDRMLQWTVLACFGVTGIMIILSPYIWTYLDDTVRSMLFLKAGTEPPHPTYYIIPLLVLAAGLTPLIWPSVYVADKESDIIKRDAQYPAFIRSLGGSVGSRSRSYALPLKKLRIHDFGPLKKNIDDLYKRLTVRIRTERAWEYFAAETHSELISKFNEMYVEGSKTGDTKKISKIISDNFVRLNGLRELKYESGSTYLWMLYGLTVSMSFLMFFGLYIVEEFTLLFRDLQMPREGAEQSGLFFFQFNESLASIPVLWATCCVVLVLHCAFSALMVKTITGSHKVTAGLHFVGLMWASTITAFVVMFLAQALMA